MLMTNSKRINCTYNWPRYVCTTSHDNPGKLINCRYQNSSVARHYSTIGYLIPIMSLFVVPIMPRARFLQNLVVTCVKPLHPFRLRAPIWLTNSGLQLLTCFAAAISLLFMWTAIKARQNTTHIPKDNRTNGPVPGTEVVSYNAAASACLGVWFFFWLWLYNT